MRGFRSFSRLPLKSLKSETSVIFLINPWTENKEDKEVIKIINIL